MSFESRVKVMVIIFLTSFILGAFSAATPSRAPSRAPILAPSLAPSPAPSLAPSPVLPARKLVAVQGVVYCKQCKYTGVETLLFAHPLPGAGVKLECNNTRHPLRIPATTDKNGYFFILAAQNVTTYGAHKCRVSLTWSPQKRCSLPTDFHGGLGGARLKLERNFTSSKPLPFALYTVGPFAFEPAQQVICP